MWQTIVTGCGVPQAIEEMAGFSSRFLNILTYGVRHGLPRPKDSDRPMMTTIAILSAKAFYDRGSKAVSHGAMTIGQLFVYTGPGLYVSFEPENEHTWKISIAHLRRDGTADDNLPVSEEIQGTSWYKWHKVPGPELNEEPLETGRFGQNSLHE